jgi:hypothetical protein
MTSLVAVLVVVGSALAVVGWVAWRLSRASRPAAPDAEWWDHFGVEKYEPLAHLLDESEFEFLRSRCGADRALLRRFRSNRARICKDFLLEMRTDFERLQAVGQALVVANRCAPGFADELFRQRVRFTRAWWRVRGQLWLWRLGISRVDAAGLLEPMRRSAAAVQAAFAPAA